MDDFFDKVIKYKRTGLTDQMFKLIGNIVIDILRIKMLIVGVPFIGPVQSQQTMDR